MHPPAPSSNVVLGPTIPLRYISNNTPGGGQRFTLSTALTLEQGSRPNSNCTLTDIVYVAGAHFL